MDSRREFLRRFSAGTATGFVIGAEQNEGMKRKLLFVLALINDGKRNHS